MVIKRCLYVFAFSERPQPNRLAFSKSAVIETPFFFLVFSLYPAHQYPRPPCATTVPLTQRTHPPPETT